MARRKLAELNLLDDFLFGTMMNYPGVGEEFGRKLLEIIFQKEFGKLTVVSQKMYYGSDTDLHGARLDVYLEEGDDAAEIRDQVSIYDVEPDQDSRAEQIRSLPRRVRFYHAKIDAGSLKSGESYKNLKNVIVIMIMPFDPLEMNRMVYTVRSKCEEEPDLDYDDGARTLFLYTKGTQGNPPEELRQLLHYMECTTEEMIREEGIEQGRREERSRTEQAEARAERAEAKVEQAERELQRLREELLRLKGVEKK